VGEKREGVLSPLPPSFFSSEISRGKSERGKKAIPLPHVLHGVSMVRREKQGKENIFFSSLPSPFFPGRLVAGGTGAEGRIISSFLLFALRSS